MCPNLEWKLYTCKSKACNRLSLGKGLVSNGGGGGEQEEQC